VCFGLTGRRLALAHRVGAGRNSRVFRIAVSAGNGWPHEFALKYYRRDAADRRDRLATEYGALQFLQRHGAGPVPRPIGFDTERNWAAYDFLTGVPPQCETATTAEIDQFVDFLARLRSLSALPESDHLPVASEATFALAPLVSSLKPRLARLAPSRAMHPDLDRFLAGVFEPLLAECVEWARGEALACGISFDEDLPPAERTLSPSDLGFHNAIRHGTDGTLWFIDFEYFGWDDPAKTLADFVLHPGMPLREELRQHFAQSTLAAFAGIKSLAARTRIVYPMFGLRWCLILLNEFLPERLAAADPDEANVGAGPLRAIQLEQATQMAARVRRDYRQNPYFHP
jgi:hypothetical protein